MKPNKAIFAFTIAGALLATGCAATNQSPTTTDRIANTANRPYNYFTNGYGYGYNYDRYNDYAGLRGTKGDYSINYDYYPASDYAADVNRSNLSANVRNAGRKIANTANRAGTNIARGTEKTVKNVANSVNRGVDRMQNAAVNPNANSSYYNYYNNRYDADRFGYNENRDYDRANTYGRYGGYGYSANDFTNDNTDIVGYTNYVRPLINNDNVYRMDRTNNNYNAGLRANVNNAVNNDRVTYEPGVNTANPARNFTNDFNRTTNIGTIDRTNRAVNTATVPGTMNDTVRLNTAGNTGARTTATNNSVTAGSTTNNIANNTAGARTAANTNLNGTTTP